MIGFDDEIADPTCSRAGCRSAAAWNVNWRNPRLHGPERVKVWLACVEHRDYLHDYLAARDFPVFVTPLGEPLDRLPDAPPAPSPPVPRTHASGRPE